MKSPQYYVRKTHRYMGLFIGIQFFLWTIGGLYFSWTNIDHIHGDHLVNFPNTKISVVDSLLSPNDAIKSAGLEKVNVTGIHLANVLGKTVYRIYTDNSLVMVNAKTGQLRAPLNKEEAVGFAKQIFKPNNDVDKVEYVTKKNIKEHYQYRENPLPAWAVTFKHPSKSVIYISANLGRFEKIRNGQWRLFDWLWMLHVMDYDTRDNINNWILRGFSILGMLTILSGFTLFYQSSKTIRKISGKTK
ncbi:MAG: hypothetical protein QM486_10675 [Flavobacteriaceae bacterium]